MGTLTHGSLFSGIGGFDLAAEWMGWENVFHCEINEFSQRVLNYYWPEAELFTDIKKSDFTKYANRIDILTGGFPCQPYSKAGKRRGKEDERHLWPEMLRAIKEIAPRYVVGENVRGLTNWNGGLVFEEVCSDLENLGYSVAPLIIPASAVNAPHERQRVFFVAYRDVGSRQKYELRSGRNVSKNGNGSNGNFTDSRCNSQESNQRENSETPKDIRGENASHVSRAFRGDGLATDSDSGKFSQQPLTSGMGRIKKSYEANSWEFFPTQPPLCSGNDGFPSELDGVAFSKWRNESIKGYGNAVVPQLIYLIFKAIEAHESLQEQNGNV
jgi:DNA (cytosine-5)-methyltransferase 1